MSACAISVENPREILCIFILAFWRHKFILAFMGMRHTADLTRRKLLGRSAVNEATALVNGVHCRDWSGASRGGYGRLWDGERGRDTHRLSYEVFVGPVPAGLDVLHRCDRPGCIEWRHLWVGTHAENMADRDAKGRNGGWKNRGHNRPSKVRGEKHPRAKLTKVQALEIKKRLASVRPYDRRDGLQALGREYGVSESLIRNIRDGKGWAWL